MDIKSGFEFLGLCTTIIVVALLVTVLCYWWFEKVIKDYPRAQAATIIIALAIAIFIIGATTGVTHR